MLIFMLQNNKFSLDFHWTSSILQLNVLLSNHLNFCSHARLPPSLAIVPAAGEETNDQIATLESNKLIPFNMKVYNCVSFNNQNKIVICCLFCCIRIGSFIAFTLITPPDDRIRQ